jgi:hypothetical protein
MVNTDKEIIPGLTSADVRKIANQVFKRTDGNHPQFNASENGFIDILQNGKPDISASPVFINKVTL